MKNEAKQEQQPKGNVAALMAKKLIAMATADAHAVLLATEKRQDADLSFRTVAINAGIALRRPNAAVSKENALHDMHGVYLDTFAKALMKERDEAKPSGYVRRIKSDFAAILGACQIHSAKVTYTKLVDGKKKNVTEQVQIAEWLKAQPNTPTVIALARLAKKAAGYKSNRGRGETIVAIKSATLAGVLSKLDGRLSLKTMQQVARWLTGQARQLVAPSNRNMLDKSVDQFMHDLARISAEKPAEVAKLERNQHGKAAQQAAQQRKAA